MATIAQYKEVERVAVVIPAFCEETTVGNVVTQSRLYVPDVIVVDDASRDATADRAQAAGATVLRRTVNGGKGAALTEGFNYALEKKFDAVVALDADGFHDPDQIPTFIETYYRTHIPVLIGNRMAGTCRLTPVRRWTVRQMSTWLNRLLDVYIADPPCGFRFYRCDVLPFLLAEKSTLPSEFETLLNIASRRIRVGSVRITRGCKLHKNPLSPFRDLFRFARVMTRYCKKRKKSRSAVRIVGDAG